MGPYVPLLGENENGLQKFLHSVAFSKTPNSIYVTEDTKVVSALRKLSDKKGAKIIKRHSIFSF